MHNDYNLPDPNCGWSSEWSSPIFEKEGAIFRLTIVPWSSKHQQILVKRWEQSPPKLDSMFFCSFFSDFLVSSLNILKPKHKKIIYIYISHITYISFLHFPFLFVCFVSERLFVMDAPVPSPVGRLVKLDAFHSPRCVRSDASARTSARSEESMACKGEPGRFPPMGWDGGKEPPFGGGEKSWCQNFFRWFFEGIFFPGKILLLMVQRLRVDMINRLIIYRVCMSQEVSRISEPSTVVVPSFWNW